MEKLVEKLDASVAALKEEVVDLGKGRKVAAVRLRKQAQEVKKVLQEIRILAMETLKALPTKKRGEKKAE